MIYIILGFLSDRGGIARLIYIIFYFIVLRTIILFSAGA